MFERFATAATRILLAAETAAAAQSTDTGIDHLLAALQHAAPSPAAAALIESGVPAPDTVTIHSAWPTLDPQRVLGPEVRAVIEAAVREALQLGYLVVTPEHMLLAVTACEPGRDALSTKSVNAIAVRHSVFAAMFSAARDTASLPGRRRAEP